MKKRMLTLMILSVFMTTAVMMGCSKTTNEDTNIEQNESQGDDTLKNEFNEIAYTTSKLEFKESMLSEEEGDFSLKISDGISAEYYGMFGNFEIWYNTEHGKEVWYMASVVEENEHLIRLEFKDNAMAPVRQPKVLGLDYEKYPKMSNVSGNMYVGYFAYVNSQQQLVYVDLNGVAPEFKIVQNLPKVQYIVGDWSDDDTLETSGIYVLGEDGAVYCIPNMDHTKSYVLEQYGFKDSSKEPVNISEKLKGKSPEDASILRVGQIGHESDEYVDGDSFMLRIKEDGKVEEIQLLRDLDSENKNRLTAAKS